MAVERKHIAIAVVIGAVISVVAGAAYLQWKRMMNYMIKFSSIRIKKITASLVDFDLMLNLNNKSDVSFDIVSQVYSVYINNKLISKAGNNDVVKISKGENIIPLKIIFSPNKILKTISAVSFLMDTQKTEIKIDIKMYVKILFIKVSIPYIYKTTVKELLTAKKVS